jgi:3-hydroxyacyl-CoA dehydrogenase/enoyl-CoA hydratase/3-hydroxybutyryl-CoA epimerase
MPTLATHLVESTLVVTIDAPDKPVNTLGVDLVGEFEGVFTRVEADPLIQGVVLVSGKRDGFIAGADIDQFRAFRVVADGERASKTGQALLERLERLRTPVVAAVHGACLGGGLEVALACTYRIASDHPKTSFALPEVQLGVIPAMGGTQRLPRLVGLQAALDMILAGRTVRAKRALQIGLVDEMVHPSILLEIAIARAGAMARGELKRPRPRSHGAVSFLLQSNPIGRSLVFRKARESVVKKTHGQYPAPLAALEAMRVGYSDGIEAGYREEAKRFGEMALTEVSRQLVFLFFASNALKKDPGVPEPAPDALPVVKLGVLGAGFMGAGIAAVAVQHDTIVRLKDTDHARVARGVASAREVLYERVGKRQITPAQADDLLTRIGGTADYTGFGDTDLVIEAVFEDLALKHAVLAEVEPLLRGDAVYASNTSTIPITRIAEAAARPERVVGMHFFSPVHRMPLLEVIQTSITDPQAVVTAVAYGKQLGKTVIVVNDGPGFYTTRTLSVYMNEAGHLLDEGIPADVIDRALVDFGFPVGPMTLLDEVGIDVGAKVGRVMYEAMGDRMAPARALRAIAESGRTGRKGKLGVYRYDEAGERGEVDPAIYTMIARPGAHTLPDAEIAQRCVLAMVNEAARCLEEQIVRSPRDADIGAVFGIGFPPFRGGPFRYVDTVGADRIVQALEELNVRFPGRFEPADILLEAARARTRFHAEP